jgi:hypothetical protein
MHRSQSPEGIEASLDREFHQAPERVGLTPEAHAGWLIDVGYRFDNSSNPSSADLRPLRWEMTVFCASDLGRNRGYVPLLGNFPSSLSALPSEI